MRISDWSSDVCSSDLIVNRLQAPADEQEWWPVEDVTEILGVAVVEHRDQSDTPPGLLIDQLDIAIDQFLGDTAPKRLHGGPVEPVDVARFPRSEERRVGKECVSTFRSRGEPGN